MDNLYILDGKTALRCEDVLQWAEFMARKEDCKVALTELEGAAVSTVFLGIDHNFIGQDGDPLLFETLVFYGDGGLGSLRRYFTWAEAAEGHEEIVTAAREEIGRSTQITDEVIASIRARLLEDRA